MCVEVNGTKFEGQGTTKKNAKLQAAEKALKSFVQFPNASEVHKVMGRKILDADFTSDDAAIDHSGDTLFNDFENGAEEMEDVANTKPVKVVLFICNILILGFFSCWYFFGGGGAKMTLGRFVKFLPNLISLF